MSDTQPIPIQAVLFDLGGVLIRTEDRRPRTMLADAFGMTYPELEKIVFGGESGDAAQQGIISAAQHWENVRVALRMREDEVDAVKTAFFGGDALDRDLLTYIRGLRPRYTVAALSNAMSDTRASLLNKWQLGDAFDHFFISAEMGMMKPDPRIYHTVLHHLALAPAETVFVDDFHHNIQAAQSVGMRTVWFRNREQAIGDLERILGNAGPEYKSRGA
jgi:epoxide hydrolase-like predicted phosphatase